MEEIIIPIKTLDNLSDSSDSHDKVRIDQPWQSRSEAYLITIKDKCEILAAEHSRKSNSYRKRYKIITLPTVILPIMLSSLNDLISDYKYFNIGFLLLISLFNGLSVFFNYAAQSEIHNNSSDKYESVVLAIDSELSKPKKFRDALDVFQTRVDMEFTHLNCSSPPI